MPLEHRRIPDLPVRPRVHPISGHIRRTYDAGRKNFARACQGRDVRLTITTENPLPDHVQARIVTEMNSKQGTSLTMTPFVIVNDRNLSCCITPEQPGFHSFRAEYSLDDGATWIRDNIPDAWILVDPPHVDSVRIYTLIPTVSGTIQDWKNDLARIGGMGFNAVHLLPITSLDTSGSPYSSSDLFAIDPSYLKTGNQEDSFSQLGEFVEEAKALNIRLCFDLVLNHVGVHSTMARRAPDWIVPDENQPDGFARAWYWSDNGRQSWNDLVLINYEHPSEAVRAEIWSYMIDYALFWAKYADYTSGLVRFDNLHSSDPKFVQVLSSALHSKYPEVGVLAEYFTDDQTLLTSVPDWELNLLLATPWVHKFVPQLREYLTYLHRASDHIRYYMPITSHDSGSPAQEFGTADSTVPRYVAAALLGTGSTGIPQGTEFGEKQRVDFIGRKQKMQYPPKARFAEFFSRVNSVLASNSAFRRGGNCQFVDNDHAAIIGAFRRDSGPDTLGFLVLCNFDTLDSQRIQIDLKRILGRDGQFKCSELLCGSQQYLQDAPLDLLLPPCGVQVLRLSINN